MIYSDITLFTQNKTMNNHMQFGRCLWNAVYITTQNTNHLFKKHYLTHRIQMAETQKYADPEQELHKQQQLCKQLPSLLQVWWHQQQYANRLHGKEQMG